MFLNAEIGMQKNNGPLLMLRRWRWSPHAQQETAPALHQITAEAQHALRRKSCPVCGTQQLDIHLKWTGDLKQKEYPKHTQELIVEMFLIWGESFLDDEQNINNKSAN